MLCEGSPLLFYTPWGPVTPLGMYQGARRLTQRPGALPGERPGAGCPIALPPSYLGWAEIQAGRRSRLGRDPGQARA